MALKDIDALAALVSLPPLPPAMGLSMVDILHVESGWVRSQLADVASLSRDVASAADTLMQDIETDLGADDAVEVLYERARVAFADDRFTQAAGLLCSLLVQQREPVDALLGLSICALRTRHYGEASVLAQDALLRGHRHPRAYCVLGVSELLQGNTSAAKDQLAMAARLGRGRPEFRDDLRLAQKALLLHQLGQ